MSGTSLLQADMGHFHFSEPGTGSKVTHYEADISFPQDFTRHVLVPADCPTIINEVSFGHPAPNNTLDRALWFKVINDCRYVQFIHQSEELTAPQDFVSNYDFYNARLADLPFESRCKDLASLEECKKKPASSDKLKISSLFPFLEIRQHAGEPVEECRFVAGAFRGYLFLTQDGVRCGFDRSANGLRVLSVDYGDFNADGVQDVLLRMMPMGRGISRMPVLLPLTRFDGEQAFSVPSGLMVEYINQ
jgi:hypothetical protein